MHSFNVPWIYHVELEWLTLLIGYFVSLKTHSGFQYTGAKWRIAWTNKHSLVRLFGKTAVQLWISSQEGQRGSSSCLSRRQRRSRQNRKGGWAVMHLNTRGGIKTFVKLAVVSMQTPQQDSQDRIDVCQWSLLIINPIGGSAFSPKINRVFWTPASIEPPTDLCWQ